MTIYYTTDDLIDPTGKNVLRKDAFETWANSMVTWSSETVPDFGISFDPIPITLEWGAKYAYVIHPKGNNTNFPRCYYFVETVNNCFPFFDQTAQKMVCRYNLRLDVLHTFNVFRNDAQINWGYSIRGTSIINRSTFFDMSSGTKFVKSNTSKVSATVNMDIPAGSVDPTGDNIYAVVAVFVEAQTTGLFKEYKISPYVMTSTQFGDNLTHDQAVGFAQMLSRTTSVSNGNPDAPIQKKVTPIQLFVLPAWYIWHNYELFEKWVMFDSNNVTIGLCYRVTAAIERVTTRYLSDYTTINPKTDHYTLHCGSYEFDLVSSRSEINQPVSLYAEIGIGNGFNLLLSIGGKMYDVTSSVEFPFNSVDENGASAQNQQRAISTATGLVSSAVGVGVGIYTGNIPAIVGGAMGGMAAISNAGVTTPSAAPTINGAGNSFILRRSGLLYVTAHNNDAGDSLANMIYGGECAEIITPATFITMMNSIGNAVGHLSPIMPNSLYLQGSVYFYLAGEFAQMFLPKIEEAIANGIMVWNDATHYTGRYIA